MIELLTSGVLTTVQDLGRLTYRDSGVPVSGAMDTNSAQLANRLLGNKMNSALLEMSLTAANIKFHQATKIAMTGADMSPQLNGSPIEMNAVIDIQVNDILQFGQLKFGARCYLGVKGGFQTEEVLGSRSDYVSVNGVFKRKKGDYLPLVKRDPKRDQGHILSSKERLTNTEIDKNDSDHFLVKVNKDFFESETLNVLPGPEFEQLPQSLQEELLGNTFTVSAQNNRMAYQLNEALHNSLKPILTSTVMPGTVQLTPAGKLIILMRDCQTTGGYPRILQLTESAINQLAQKKSGDRVSFII